MAISKDLSAFVPERCIYAFGENDDGSMSWVTNQVSDLTINVDGEEVTKSDAQGNTIFSLTRAKTCTINFSTPIFDLNLVSAMNGSERNVGDDTTNRLDVPKMELIKVSDAQATAHAIVLAETVLNSGTSSAPVYKISVSSLTADGSTKRKFTRGTVTGDGVFTYTANTKTITFKDGDIVEGDKLLITYEYETGNAIQMVNSAEEFPQASRVKMLVKGYDICSTNTVIYLWLILPNAKFATNYSLSMGIDQDISCTLNCAYDYCSDERELYRMVIAE